MPPLLTFSFLTRAAMSIRSTYSLSLQLFFRYIHTNCFSFPKYLPNFQVKYAAVFHCLSYLPAIAPKAIVAIQHALISPITLIRSLQPCQAFFSKRALKSLSLFASSLPSLFSISLLSLILPHSFAHAAVIPRNIRTVVAAPAPVAGGSRGGAADTGHADNDTASLCL